MRYTVLRVDALLQFVLTEVPEPAPMLSAQDALARYRTLARRFPAPVDAAVAAGFGADRLGYAFAGSYQAALQRLLDARTGDAVVAFCATERGGAHPRAIETTLTEGGDGWLLDGRKTFVTFGSDAETLVVIATDGTVDGRNRLRAVTIDSRRAGIALDDRPPISFAPEIRHAELTMSGVRVGAAEVLPGDGFDDYLRPFRTIEDAHVLAGMFGWLIQIARRYGWPGDIVTQSIAAVLAIRGVAEADPVAPTTHVALGGIFGMADSLLESAAPHWVSVDEAVRERWLRDRPLLTVASEVRNRRLAAAWDRLGATPAAPR